MNILTFDIEEWFHILDNDSTKTEKEWSNYQTRIHSNMDLILNFLESKNLKATFFVVGWIAEKYPEIVKRIDEMGFEIGSHTHMHQLMYEHNFIQAENDLKKSIFTIEDIIGKKVKYFRAPGFSITVKNQWVFDLLHKHGITHDCSVFPAGRAHGGMPKFSQSIPSIITFNGNNIKEFPINTTTIFGKKWIYSGGGYFRLSPYFLIKRWSLKTNYIMTYFHPRDFDFNQPVIKDLNIIRKFKCYVGIKNCLKKLDHWTSDFKFIDLKSADELIDWSSVPIVEL